MRVELSRTAFSVFDQAWIDANRDGVFSDDERVVDGAGEMFIDLDDEAPGAADAGEYNYPSEWHFGMEGGNWLRDSQSTTATRYLASEGDYEITLFRSSPAHTVFRLEGWHRDPDSGRQFGRYTLYLHFYAGQSFLRASHTWVMTGDPERNFIRRMALDLPLAQADGALDYAFGGAFETEGAPVSFIDGEPPYVPITRGQSEIITGTVDASGEASIVSIGPDKYYHNVPLERDLRVSYEVLADGDQVASGYGASGWADISTNAMGLAAGVRDFWRNHPKEVSYRDGVLSIYLWPDHGDKVLDLRRRYEEVRGPASELGQAARREFVVPGSAVGLAHTTDIFILLHRGTMEPEEVDALFRGFEDPLRPRASGEWNMATGVLGPVHPYDPESFPMTENYMELTFAWMLRAAEEFSWYGMLDYGDHLIEYESLNWELNVPANWGLFQNWGYSGWMQEAYRLGPWMLVEYLRGGRHRYFREADQWVRHHRDVDCVFWDTPDDGPRPGDNSGSDRLGGGHRHDQQHFGAYLVGYGIPTIATTHHYFLTGEGRDLDALRVFSEFILERARLENQGIYSVLYMAEALDDPSLISETLDRNVTPDVGFGRVVYDSGMGLLLHDIQTNGAPEVRERLRRWAEQDETEFAYIRGYLESVEGTGAYSSAIADDVEEIFPANNVRSQYYDWASRQPADFRDVMSPDFMPNGPLEWPLRSIEHLVFDGPFGLGNNPSRSSVVTQLIWLMEPYGSDP